MIRTPNAHEVCAMILRIARRQAATSACGQAILSGGFAAELDGLMAQVAGCCANPLVDAFNPEDPA